MVTSVNAVVFGLLITVWKLSRFHELIIGWEEGFLGGEGFTYYYTILGDVGDYGTSGFTL